MSEDIVLQINDCLPKANPTVQQNETKTSRQKKSNNTILSKKNHDQLINWFRRFKRIIQQAKQKQLNESDTSNIINDLLWDLFWYDKYFDVTTEYKIKSQYCDYWIKINWKLVMLMEVKQIWVDLNDNHLRQATSYAGNEWIKRVILTNLRKRQLYYLSFWAKIEKDLIFEFDILSDDKPSNILANMQYLHKESLVKNHLDKLLKQKLALSEKNIKKVLFSNSVIKKIQSEIRSTTWFKITEDQTKEVLKQYIKY